jgi:hypothetical protein
MSINSEESPGARDRDRCVFPLDKEEGSKRGNDRYRQIVGPPGGSRARSREFLLVRDQVQRVGSVIGRRGAALRIVDFCGHAGGKGLAGDDREGLPAHCAGVCK